MSPNRRTQLSPATDTARHPGLSHIGALPRLPIEESRKLVKDGIMNRLRTSARVYLITLTALVGVATAGIGVWCLVDPRSFAEFVGFDEHEHFLHDVGAFQVGLGVTLLLALIWSDALATALAGFIVANTIHTVNHVTDLDLGGSSAQAWVLGITSVALTGAFALRLHQLGYVLGTVTVVTDPTLARFVRQKTIRLTTFRKDGTPGTSPVSIVVEGDRAYFRSFERAVKVRRIGRNPNVEFGPSTASGKATGAMLPGRARMLEGEENRTAARLLRGKYPFLHGVVVPLSHRLMRSKFGRTVHFELVPASSSTAPAGVERRNAVAG
jgi:PPOX class probable F420-dependent enzyme